jgi:hypothetical protein
MSAQRGFLYEEKIHNKLKAQGLVPKGFTPAKANPNLPDSQFVFKNGINNLEIKLNLATDYGQGTLNYNNGVWSLGGAQTPQAEVLRDLMRGVGIEAFVNSEWGPKGEPFKVSTPTEQFTREMVASDYARFGDRFKVISSSALHSYYASKGTYYIQIGGYGLYYMAANPLGLPIPQFNPGLRIRIRTKRGGSYPINNYRFTTALQVTSRPGKSRYDIDRNIDFLKQ